MIHSRYKRRAPSKPLKPRVVVATEGKSTEPYYLRIFWRIHGSENLSLDLTPVGRDPRRVVERAIEEREKSQLDPDAQHDSFWAMFDRDDHTKYREALDLAAAKDIHKAISNPSFELWAILHYEDQDGPIDRRKCQRKLRALFPGYGQRKRFTDEAAIKNQYESAVSRARTLLVNRYKEGEPLGNPSTTVHELTELLRLGK